MLSSSHLLKDFAFEHTMNWIKVDKYLWRGPGAWLVVESLGAQGSCRERLASWSRCRICWACRENAVQRPVPLYPPLAISSGPLQFFFSRSYRLIKKASNLQSWMWVYSVVCLCKAVRKRELKFLGPVKNSTSMMVPARLSRLMSRTNGWSYNFKQRYFPCIEDGMTEREKALAQLISLPQVLRWLETVQKKIELISDRSYYLYRHLHQHLMQNPKERHQHLQPCQSSSPTAISPN